MSDWIIDLPWEIIRATAEKLSIEPYLIAALIMAESSGNVYATRYEPNWRYPMPTEFSMVIAEELNVTLQTELQGSATSWGPMQVMGTVAREYGFRGYFPELCSNELGIYFGAMHFKSKLIRYGIRTDAISAYNAGNIRKKPSGVYDNERYVDKVMGFFRELEKTE